MKEIIKPIGLDNFCDIVESICKSTVYKYIRPPHLIVQLDPGPERLEALAYMAKMYKKYHILRFTCGPDDYLYLEKLNGDSTQKINDSFHLFSDGAIYENDFSNIGAINISEMAKHINAIQFKDFLNRTKNLCNTASVVFFVGSSMSQNEERMIAKLVNHIDHTIERIAPESYTNDMLANIIRKKIRSYGIEVENETEFLSMLKIILDGIEKTDMNAVDSLTEELLFYVDFTCFTPRITNQSLDNYKYERRGKRI